LHDAVTAPVERPDLTTMANKAWSLRYFHAKLRLGFEEALSSLGSATSANMPSAVEKGLAAFNKQLTTVIYLTGAAMVREPCCLIASPCTSEHVRILLPSSYTVHALLAPASAPALVQRHTHLANSLGCDLSTNVTLAQAPTLNATRAAPAPSSSSSTADTSSGSGGASAASASVEKLLMRWIPRPSVGNVFVGDVVAFNSPLSPPAPDPKVPRRVSLWKMLFLLISDSAQQIA